MADRPTQARDGPCRRAHRDAEVTRELHCTLVGRTDVLHLVPVERPVAAVELRGAVEERLDVVCLEVRALRARHREIDVTISRRIAHDMPRVSARGVLENL